MKSLATILSILGLYIGFWLAKSIYVSTLDGSATIESIIHAEWVISGIVCAIICFINCVVFDSSAEFTIALIVVACLVAFKLPYSIGLAVVFNSTLVGCILTTIWKK